MRIYFMGIGGVAMGHAALLAKEQGDEVVGTDGPIYSPMKEALAGLEIYQGYDAERLKRLKPDAVVIGNSIGRGNPELEWFWNEKPCAAWTMADFLYERVLKNRRTIAVCGTHGKTTTTTLTAYLLKAGGAKPGWFVGGVPQDLPSGACLGEADAPFVIEGDEYNSAFCDQRAKFVAYRPTVAVLNNLEPDHLDIYRDMEDLRRAFYQLLKVLPGNGLVVANRDDVNLRAILPLKWVNTLWVSAQGDPEAQLQIKNYRESPEDSEFELHYEGKLWARVEWEQWGIFNARNAAMAALAAAWTKNPADIRAFDLSALKDFVGVKRRQQVRHASEEVVVVEDFAHHPTAVTLTVNSLRNRFPGRRWVACLEPRSNTSRTNAHQITFPAALASADVAVLAPVYAPERIAPEKRLDVAKLEADIRALGREVHRAESCAQIPAILQRLAEASPQPLGVVFFSNGTFEGAMDEYLASLAKAPAKVEA